MRYAIHPVAAACQAYERAPREANVPYDNSPKWSGEWLVDSTDVRSLLEERRRNPAAREDPSSPIYGMPILDADNAKHVVVLSAV